MNGHLAGRRQGAPNERRHSCCGSLAPQPFDVNNALAQANFELFDLDYSSSENESTEVLDSAIFAGCVHACMHALVYYIRTKYQLTG